MESGVATPSTKEEGGKHDENISFEKMKEFIDPKIAGQLKELSIRIFTEASQLAEQGVLVIPEGGRMVQTLKVYTRTPSGLKVKDEFVSEPWPAWTAIGITELAVPGARVEIRATAGVGG